MAMRNTATEWGWIAKSLHWLIAIGIFWLIWLGLEQADMERGPEKLAARATHASWALLILVLMTVRLVWRATNPTPAHPDGTPGWQRASATFVHWAIYIAVFTQLIAGAMTTATGDKPLPFFGLFSLPLPIAEDEDAHHFWEEVHEFAWKPLAALIAVHFAAALYNHFVRKNDVLRRMTAGSTSRQ